MEDVIRLESQRLADELYQLLQSLDPATWRSDLEAATSEKLDAIKAHAHALLARTQGAADERVRQLREKLQAVARMLDEFSARREALVHEVGALRGAIAGGLAARRDAVAGGLAARRDAMAGGLAARRDAVAAGIAARRDALAGEVATRRDALTDAMGREWRLLGARLRPAYEQMAQTLRACHVVAPSLRPTNYKRNFFHMLSALAALLMLEHVLTQGAAIAVTAALALTAWTLETTRRWWPAWNAVLMRALGAIAHPHEAFRVNSATWYVTALFVLATTMPVAASASALAVLGLADPAAAILGRRYGRRKIVNNRSWVGTGAFLAVASAATAGVFALYHPEVGLAGGALLVAGGALAGTLAELFSRRLDDNLTIPLSVGAAVTLLLPLAG